MISSEEASRYDELTECSNNYLKYIVEPAIKNSAKLNKHTVKLLVVYNFVNLTFFEKLFCADNTIINKYFSEYDSCYKHPPMFFCMNKILIQHILNVELSSLGYIVMFNDVKHEKINAGFSISISW